MTPQSIFAHRPDLLHVQESYEGIMQLELLLAQHRAGVENVGAIARSVPVDPAIIEEMVMEHFSPPSEEELSILCSSGAQFMFEKNKGDKEKITISRDAWKKIVRTRLTKARLIFPTAAQWLSIATQGIGLTPSIDLTLKCPTN